MAGLAVRSENIFLYINGLAFLSCVALCLMMMQVLKPQSPAQNKSTQHSAVIDAPVSPLLPPAPVPQEGRKPAAVPPTLPLSKDWAMVFDTPYSQMASLFKLGWVKKQSFRGIPIPQDLNSALLAADAMTPFTYNELLNLAHAESGLNPKALNKDSGALGAFQLRTPVTLEMLYRIKVQNKYPHIREARLVHRTVKEDGTYAYSIKGGNADKILKDVRTNPYKAVFIAAENKVKYLQELKQAFPKTELTGTHAYLVHWLGGGGAKTFIANLKKNPNKLAYAMFEARDEEGRWISGNTSRTVQINKSVFYDAGKERWRTYAEVYAHLAKERGLGEEKIRNVMLTPGQPANAITLAAL